METIGDRIAFYLKSQRMTKVAFAATLKVDQSYVTRLVTGERQPSTRLIEDMCEKFGINSDWLVNGEGEMFSTSSNNTLDIIAKKYSDSPSFRQLLDVYASLDRAEQDEVEHYIMLLAEAVARGQDPALVDPTADDLEANAAALSQQAAGHEDAAADS